MLNDDYTQVAMPNIRFDYVYYEYHDEEDEGYLRSCIFPVNEHPLKREISILLGNEEQTASSSASCVSLASCKIDSQSLTTLGKLGHGVNGTVYLGVYKPTQAKVAIKRANRLSEESTQELLEEANLMQPLNESPFVLKLIGVCVEQQNEVILKKLASHNHS